MDATQKKEARTTRDNTGDTVMAELAEMALSWGEAQPQATA